MTPEEIIDAILFDTHKSGRDVVTTLEAAGYVIVPKEPTAVMVKAAKAALYRYIASLPEAERNKSRNKDGGHWVEQAKKTRLRWDAMLEAAIAPSEQPSTP